LFLLPFVFELKHFDPSVNQNSRAPANYEAAHPKRRVLADEAPHPKRGVLEDKKKSLACRQLSRSTMTAGTFA
jgi:hypothetical protein